VQVVEIGRGTSIRKGRSSSAERLGVVMVFSFLEPAAQVTGIRLQR